MSNRERKNQIGEVICLLNHYFLLPFSEVKRLRIRKTKVTGEHLEKDKLERKLVRIAEPGEEMIEEMPRKVKVIILIQYGGSKQKEEVYYKVWYRKRRGEIDSKKIETISEGLGMILGDL